MTSILPTVLTRGMTTSASSGTTAAGVNDIGIDSDGLLAFSTEKQACAEVIESLVLTRQGECVFDTTLGIPYAETIWRSCSNLPAWAGAMRDIVKNCSFVDSITSFTYKYDPVLKRLTYTMNITLIDGTSTTIAATV